MCEHKMTRTMTAVNWNRAEHLDATVMVCVCCDGPAPVELLPVATSGHYGIGRWCKVCHAEEE